MFPRAYPFVSVLLPGRHLSQDDDAELSTHERHLLNARRAHLARRVKLAENPDLNALPMIFPSKLDLDLDDVPTVLAKAKAALESENLSTAAAADRLLQPTTARRFLHNLFHGGFAELDPELHARGLVGLTTEQKLMLYESIAQEVHPENLRFLSALNDQMGLTTEFYQREAQQFAEFFGANNLDKNLGLMNSIQEFLNPAPRYSQQQDQALLQNILNACCDFCGIKRKPLTISHDKDKNLHGSYNPVTDGIWLNSNSRFYHRDRMKVLEVLVHEARHGKEQAMAADYRAGRIKKGDRDYIAARVFHANINTAGGYIGSDANFRSYEAQPAEIDARTAAAAAINELRIALAAHGAPRRLQLLTRPQHPFSMPGQLAA